LRIGYLSLFLLARWAGSRSIAPTHRMEHPRGNDAGAGPKTRRARDA